MMTAEELAQTFHETYERLAPEFGYSTRVESAVPWADVPEQNKALMIATAEQMLRAREAESPPPVPVFHIWGFVRDGKATSVGIGTHQGELAEIATSILEKIKTQGHHAKTSTLRTLDGWLVEVYANVTVMHEGQIQAEMWHVFTKRNEAWPTEAPQ